jgi:hypothetical protein
VEAHAVNGTEPSAADRIARIEAIVCREVGRGIEGLLGATRGNLGRAAESLAAVKVPRVGIITGFYVPQAEPPAAETDGLVGAAHLAAGLTAAGMPVRIATDQLCVTSLRSALDAAIGATVVPVDVVAPGPGATAGIAGLSRRWVESDFTHVIAIERCGRAQDGKAYNMRGLDISAWTAPLDDLFLAGNWVRIGIGDGGNEIGMGAIAQEIVEREVPNGALIACRTGCDHLLAVGVSNWGAYALLGALAVLRPDRAERLTQTLKPLIDLAILTRTVNEGGAVDGVLRRRIVCVDGHPPGVHAEVIRAIRDAAGLAKG